MMHRAWSSIVEVPCCFSRSYVKFQGHTALRIVGFDLHWAFPDCNSSLNSPMAMKCCTKLETAKERCPIVFQGHPSNFKVTRCKTSPILTQIGRVWIIGGSQLSNPSDLPCYIKRNVFFISCFLLLLMLNLCHFISVCTFLHGNVLLGFKFYVVFYAPHIRIIIGFRMACMIECGRLFDMYFELHMHFWSV